MHSIICWLVSYQSQKDWSSGHLYDAYGQTLAFSIEGIIILICVIIFAKADFETRLKEVHAASEVPA